MKGDRRMRNALSRLLSVLVGVVCVIGSFVCLCQGDWKTGMVLCGIAVAIVDVTMIRKNQECSED